MGQPTGERRIAWRGAGDGSVVDGYVRLYGTGFGRVCRSLLAEFGVTRSRSLARRGGSA
jgi:hypothetical protein